MSRATIGILPAFTLEADRMEKYDKVSKELQRMLTNRRRRQSEIRLQRN